MKNEEEKKQEQYAILLDGEKIKSTEAKIEVEYLEEEPDTATLEATFVTKDGDYLVKVYKIIKP